MEATPEPILEKVVNLLTKQLEKYPQYAKFSKYLTDKDYAARSYLGRKLYGEKYVLKKGQTEGDGSMTRRLRTLGICGFVVYKNMQVQKQFTELEDNVKKLEEEMKKQKEEIKKLREKTNEEVIEEVKEPNSYGLIAATAVATSLVVGLVVFVVKK